MKKLLLSTLMLLTLAATKTNAQVKDNLSFGPILGFGHSTISGEIEGEEAKKSFNASYNIGVRLMYSSHPHWAFGGDMSFRTEGVKIASTSSDEKINLKSNYFRIDPKAYYFLGEQGQSFRPKIGIGPSFGFLVGGKTKILEGSTVIDEGNTSDIINGFDLGLAGALGFNYRLSSKTWLNVDATYTHGLLDIIKENDEEAIHNRSLFLNVGVLFGIGGAKK